MAQIERRKIADLKPDPSNVRAHDARNLDAIRASLRTFGQQKPIVVDASGVVIAGNGTLLAAEAEGWGEIDVVVSDLEGASRTAYAIADNRTAELAAWHDDALAKTLEALRADPTVDELVAGFTGQEIDELLAAVGGVSGHVVEDEPPALLPEPVGRVGDLWLLGRHRVLCGDSTQAADVGFVLAANTPRLMVTDPPYGVNYDPKWRDAALPSAWGKPRATGLVTNDDQADWSDAYRLSPAEVAYVWHPPGAIQGVFLASLAATDWIVRMTVIWAKNHFPISRGHYHVQHEPCFYAVRKGKTASWLGDRTQTTLWQIKNASAAGGGKGNETGHGTQKPLECMARPIRNHEGDVYDPFLGSGTTLIAAEQLGRTCYGIEIEPRYVDVVIRRWMAATGQEAVRESDGAKWTDLADGVKP